MTDSEAREMARDLVRGSIIEDAAAQFIAQILKHAHDERIKPLQARLTAAEAEVEKLRGAAQRMVNVWETSFYGTSSQDAKAQQDRAVDAAVSELRAALTTEAHNG